MVDLLNHSEGVVGGYGAREVITLDFGASVPCQEFDLRFIFGAFTNNSIAEVTAESNDRLHYDFTLGILLDIPNEGAVDFDGIYRKPP